MQGRFIWEKNRFKEAIISCAKEACGLTEGIRKGRKTGIDWSNEEIRKLAHGRRDVSYIIKKYKRGNYAVKMAMKWQKKLRSEE